MASEHPGAARVFSALQSTFGYTSFRPLQEEIVAAMVRGDDVFALLPTGGGKSLCYQLPAVLADGLTVVVSPLIALMKDQVDAMEAIGVAGTFINSSLDWQEAQRRQQSVGRGEVKLLYVAPERLNIPGFQRLLRSLPIARFVIDEAHCISEWGHDFRPEYRELRQLREMFPATPVGAFTATATPRVQDDVVAQLGLRSPSTFRGSFNRPNLYYEVRPKQNAYAQLVAYLRAHRGESGIVYCFSKAGTDDLAANLAADGFSAAAYHAGLGGELRRQRQDAFIQDDTEVMVATIAFGMGIDKPDVRFVVHYDLPRSLDAYYQESGRAGRDGARSDCILFFSHADVEKQEYFIEQRESPSEQRVGRQQLREMVSWARGSDCRRRELLAYFGEPFEGQPGFCCDLCEEPGDPVDATIPTQMLLSAVKRTNERFGAAYIIDLLRGSRSERVLRYGHDKLSVHGIGRQASKEEWQHWVRQLLRAGYLQETKDEYPVLRITAPGNAVLFQREKVSLPPPPSATAPARTRRRMGTSRAVTGTVQRTVDLLAEGKTIAQIARARSLEPRTIEGHLADAIEAGATVDLDRLVSPAKRQRIEAVIRRVGGTLLRPFYEALGETCTYAEIQLVLAAIRRAEHPDG